MPDEEKDKYDELDDLDDLEAQLEELPVEEEPEPFGEPTAPMDELVEQGQVEAAQEQGVQGVPQEGEPAGESSPRDGGTRSDLGKKIEDAAKVRDASEVLRGRKQVKVIKKSAIKAIVDEIIKVYGGIEHKELLSKIAEYEFSMSSLRSDKKALAEELERLKRELQDVRDETAIKYEKELEDLRMRLASAEKLLAVDGSQERVAQLEEEVLRLRRRVDELERGLEFAAVIEDYDYGLAIETALEHRQKIGEISELIDKAVEAEPEQKDMQELREALTALSKRCELLEELFKRHSATYMDYRNKVHSNEGSIDVVAELIRLNARNRGWGRELQLCGQFVEKAESIVRGK